jgi:extradiol dioxygenase family protein
VTINKLTVARGAGHTYFMLSVDDQRQILDDLEVVQEVDLLNRVVGERTGRPARAVDDLDVGLDHVDARLLRQNRTRDSQLVWKHHIVGAHHDHVFEIGQPDALLEVLGHPEIVFVVHPVVAQSGEPLGNFRVLIGRLLYINVATSRAKAARQHGLHHDGR